MSQRAVSCPYAVLLAVLIPFQSGLCLRVRRVLTLISLRGLNPFSIRAMSQRKSLKNLISDAVLIPFQSGLCLRAIKQNKPLTIVVLIPFQSGLCLRETDW